jgi:hypothetical protein
MKWQIQIERIPEGLKIMWLVKETTEQQYTPIEIPKKIKKYIQLEEKYGIPCIGPTKMGVDAIMDDGRFTWKNGRFHTFNTGYFEI